MLVFLFMKTLMLAALATASLVFAPIASATPTDDAYLQALHSHGLSSKGGDDDLVQVGHAICQERKLGMSEQDVITQLTPSASNGVTASDVTFIVQTAEHFYCSTPGTTV